MEDTEILKAAPAKKPEAESEKTQTMARRSLLLVLFFLVLVIFISLVTLRDQYFCQSNSHEDARICFPITFIVCSEFRQNFNCRTAVATPLNILISLKLGYDTSLLFKVCIRKYRNRHNALGTQRLPNSGWLLHSPRLYWS